MAAPQDPYTLALKWLALRELSEFQIRQRLRRRQVEPDTIDEVVARLQRGKALDDLRTARASARTDALVKRHGRYRVLRHVEALGIDRELARRAVAEVFAEVDEEDVLDRALTRRLGQGRRVITDRAEYRRLYRYLVNQGFEPSAVSALLRARSRSSVETDEE